MRGVAILLTSIILATGSVATAQNGPTEGENGRYSFSKVDGGYLRLDQQNGQLSLCTRREVGWGCHPVPDERTALEEEIARLQKENAGLKKELVSRGIIPPGAKSSGTSEPAKPEAGIKLPSDAEIDRAMAYLERVWKRLVEMIGRLQRDSSSQL